MAAKSKENTRDALSTFVPQTMKWILQQETNISFPYSKQFPSVALFADISGFTNLTEKLSSLPGTLGVEILADEINNYLTQIIKQIVGSGGDIFKFAGDALLCVWPPTLAEINDDNMIMAWKNLSKTVLRVIRCALDIQKSLGEMSKCGVPELTLRVKLGIGVGIVDVLVVGGVFGRFENLPAGQAFFEAFECENDCQPQQVIISNKCYQMVKDKIGECESVGKKGNYLVKSITFRIGKRRNMMNDAQQLKYNTDATLFKKFSRYIPSAVVPHLRMPEQAWVGELRQVTIMFLSLPFNSTDIKNIGGKGKKVLVDIHNSIKALQQIIYRYQGSLNKFLVDDKGSTVMAVFGLPPVAHRNDPERAVMAALDLRKKFKARYTKNLLGKLGNIVEKANKTQEDYDRDKNQSKKNKKGKKDKKDKKKNIIAIGITSGIVYLGLIGGAGSRREYSVLGDKVNLAARLMGLSKKEPLIYGEIAVDESIKSKVFLKHELEWKFIKTTKVKGKKQHIHVYSPKPLKLQNYIAEPPTAWLTDASDKSYITECCRITERMIKFQFGKVVFVEGEAGLGKAALISRVMNQTKKRIWWLWGKGIWVHETRETMKFPVWKQILLSFELQYPFFKIKNRQSFELYIERRRPDLNKWLFLLSYFSLLSFIEPSERSKLHSEKEIKNLTTEKLATTIWERNDKLVGELKDKIQIRMSDEIRKFNNETLPLITDAKLRKIRKQKKEEEWRISAEKKVNKKIGNFIYDIVLCLLEWAGGKLHGNKPICIVIDGLQWLRQWDWSLTRRLCLMLNNKILKYVSLFVSSTPMDIRRYTPHYIAPNYIPQYKEMRDNLNAFIINPAAWGIQKTKSYIKSYFKHNHNINVRDVSPKLVETVHSQCGGRPGFCKEFLDILYNLNGENGNGEMKLLFDEMRYKGEKKLSFAYEFEQHLSSRQLYASIPIPPVVQAIIARHLDVLNPESMLCLKTASTICISKGTRCLSFLKSTLKGSHPIKQFVEDEKKINDTLQKLCDMKFIAKLPSKQDISHAIDLENTGNNNAQQRKKTLPCQLYKQSSIINNTEHGHLENHYQHNPIHHHKHQNTDTSIKDRYGSSINNVVNRNKMHDSISIDGISGGVNHLRSFSSFSDKSNTQQSTIDGFEYETNNQNNNNVKMIDDENKNKLSHNMPLTSQLLIEPLHKVPWKKGMLNKSKGGLLSSGTDRAFVFKNKTLYWFRDTSTDKYPLGRIKFDESILRLQLTNEKKFEILIKVSRKKYILRAKNLNECNEWFRLFQNAMNSNNNENQNQNQNQNNNLNVITTNVPEEASINNFENENENKSEDHEHLTNSHGECYEFTHGFLRDAIYEAMLSTQRIRIHKTAQEYLRKVLKAISYLPDYNGKDVDVKDYTSLLQRHLAIAQNYQKLQNNIGEMVNEKNEKNKQKKSMRKKRKKKQPGFIGLHD